MKGQKTVIVMLIGSLLLASFVVVGLMQSETSRALRGPEVAPGTDPASIEATTLKLAIPNFPLQKEYTGTGQDGTTGHRVLNLWSYTTYDGNMADLSYEAKMITNRPNYLAFEIMDGHFLSVTVTTHLAYVIDMQVEVTDGTLIYHDQFVITICAGPRIDFYDDYAGQPVPDPLVIAPGESLAEPIDLKYYSWHGNAEPVDDPIYTVINNPPASLGITIYIEPNPGIGECEYCLDLNPTVEAVGNHEVEVQFENTCGLTATDILNIRVVGKVFLPTVVKNR